MATVYFPIFTGFKIYNNHEMDTVGFFPGVKWLECEADHSLPSNADVKSEWSYTSTPPSAFIACTKTTLPV
jgi:hypothetical protein